MTALPGPRRRFWIEVAAASFAGLLAVATLVWPDWIERIFAIEPDGGSGALEWLIVGAVFAVSVCFAVAARLEWRRARLAEATRQ